MRTVLKSVSYAAVLTGVVLAMSLPAAGVQAAGVQAAGTPSAARPFPGRDIPAAATAASGYSLLYGVFCASANDCWAVGQRSSGAQLANLMLHWNGRSWSQSAVPNPSKADDELFNVRCLSATDCWTVGQYLKGNAWLAEALHWTGKKWISTKVAAYGGTGDNDATELYDSTCTASDNCWAVGSFGLGLAPPEKELNLSLHWNGKAWSKVPTPNPGGIKLTDSNFLGSVRCVSASDCNAAGAYGSIYTAKDIQLNEVLHWNGKHWTWIHVPNPAGTGDDTENQIEALACGARTSCWGAGLAGRDKPTQTYANEILHWNGSTWTTAKIPNPGGTKTGDSNFLFGATCDGSANCWAVGDYRNSDGADVNEALHWNGTRWSYVGTPNPAGSESLDRNGLYQVRCTSSTNCWAVGGQEPYLGTETAEILHWNGKRWSIART
jgi:hypothetical protein